MQKTKDKIIKRKTQTKNGHGSKDLKKWTYQLYKFSDGSLRLSRSGNEAIPAERTK